MLLGLTNPDPWGGLDGLKKDKTWLCLCQTHRNMHAFVDMLKNLFSSKTNDSLGAVQRVSSQHGHITLSS